MRLCVHVRKSRREVERLAHVFFFTLRCSSLGKPPCLDVAHEFLDGRGDRDRENDAEESGEFSADDEREDDEQGRHADDARDDERIDEMALELLRDDVEARS